MKMTAKELRLGNKVNYFDRFTTVDILHLKYILEGSKDFKPIQLTEEILLKCGFEEIEPKKDFPSFISPQAFIQINFINGSWIEYVSRVKIKGLHHLQNIYYFRTEQELQINL